MDHTLVFNADLIRRYDQTGPRYTSYPTAAQFSEDFGDSDYREWVRHSNEDPIPHPLSLYIHIPFCDTVCFYCDCNKIVTKDHSRAITYLEHLKRELTCQGEMFDRDRIVEQLHWGGGTPTFLSHQEMRDLMASTRENFTLRDDDKGEYSIEVDPRRVDESTIPLLRELGFNRLSLGVQDFDPVVQKAVNRIQGEEETLMVMDTARRESFRSINVDLIYGLPHQTASSFIGTIDKIIHAAPDRIAVYNYAHLPERFPPQRRIREEDLPSPSEKLIILQQTIERLAGAGYLYIGMDHFARPDDELAIAQRNGTLHRNFQGYSSHAECDMVGIGVTSIGRVADNFSQNAKDLETYYQRIEENGLAIERGLESEPDDLLRREIITSLMCHFLLDINQLEKKWHFSFRNHFADEVENLRRLQEDGLLVLNPNSLRILPAGRLLVRNICMVFDHYLPKDKTQQGFSRVI